jgi:hypothetical protein
MQGINLYSATNQVHLTDVVIDQVIPRLARPILIYGCCLSFRVGEQIFLIHPGGETYDLEASKLWRLFRNAALYGTFRRQVAANAQFVRFVTLLCAHAKRCP